jgi:hypothetical protein
VQAFLPQKSKQGIRMKICKSEASITVQMFWESLKIERKATMSMSCGNQKQCCIYQRHSLLKEGFCESFSFPHNFTQSLKRNECWKWVSEFNSQFIPFLTYISWIQKYSWYTCMKNCREGRAISEFKYKFIYKF